MKTHITLALCMGLTACLGAAAAEKAKPKIKAKAAQSMKKPTAAEVAKAKAEFIKGLGTWDLKKKSTFAILQGPRSVHGRVKFPSALPKGRAIMIDVHRRDTGSTGNSMGMLDYTKGGKEQPFKILNLAPGTYNLEISVDADGDNRMTDVDLVGQYTANDSMLLKVGDKDQKGIEITVAVKEKAVPTAEPTAIPTSVPTVEPTLAPTEALAPTPVPTAAASEAPAQP